MVVTEIENNGMIEIISDLHSCKKVPITGAYAIKQQI
jgi:hypothetical protein